MCVAPKADCGGETDSRQRAVSREEEREVLLVVVEGSEIGRVTAKALQVKIPEFF